MADHRISEKALRGGRKYKVVLIVTGLMACGMTAGVVGAVVGADMSWLTVTLPVLAAVYPAYMGANAISKKRRGEMETREDL